MKSFTAKSFLKFCFFASSILGYLFLLQDKFKLLAESRYPDDIDAFYYLQELSHWVQFQKGYYSNFSFFYITSKLGAPFVTDERQLYYLISYSSLFMLSFAFALFFFNRRAYFLLPAVLSFPWLSEVIYSLHNSFLRQAFSVSIFILGFVLYLTCKNNSNKFIYKTIALLTIFLSASMHMFTAYLAGLILLFDLLFSHIGLSKKSWAISILLLTALTIMYLSGKGVLTIWPLYPEFGWQRVCRIGWCRESEMNDLIYQTLIWFVLIISAIKLKIQSWPFLATAFVWLFLNLPIWNLQSGMADRLGFGASWVLFLSIFCFYNACRNKKFKHLLIVTVYLGFVILYFLKPKVIYAKSSLPRLEFKEKSEILLNWIPDNSFILAPHGSQFAVTYFLGIQSANKMIFKRNIKNIYKVLRIKNNEDECIDLAKEEDLISSDIKCILLNKYYAIKRMEY